MRPASKGCKIVACCGKAQRDGVRAGMLQAEALATLPALLCIEEDLDADRLALAQLAEWSLQFSPIVGLEDVIAPTCLFLDTTGGDSCFGGEARLIRQACEAFSKSGWTVSIALADTLGAAWGVSHFPRFLRAGIVERGACAGSSFALMAPSLPPSPPAPLPRGEGSEGSPLPGGEGSEGSPLPGGEGGLLDLPIAALRLSERIAGLLGQFGIERIEQLAALPREQVADRFGPEVRLRLDQALGRAAEVIVPFHAQPEAAASWVFDDPVERRDVVAKVLDLLLERLQAILEIRCCGTRLVECALEQEGIESQRLECSLSRPARTAAYLGALLHPRLEQMRVQAPIRAMRLRALVLERLPEEQRSLFDAEGGEDGAALAQLLDSLVARLGREAVTRARFVADAQPELGCRFECALESGPAPEDEWPVFAHRPLRLFPRPLAIQVVALVPVGTPQRFHHAGVDYTAARCQGPERIETGWWRFDDIRRDYYMVEASDGTRWWIFQRLDDGRWFLHGCFD